MNSSLAAWAWHEAALGDQQLQIAHELRAHAEHDGFFSRKAQVCKHVALASGDFLFHAP